MKCYWIIGDQFNFARETRSGRCCSFNGAATFGGCGLWHLHGQDFWEDHRSGTALWHPTQLQSCFLHQLHRYLEKNEGLPGRCHQVSLVSLPFSLFLVWICTSTKWLKKKLFFFFNRGCPQCRVKSSFYIPSKHWVCDGEEKASLIASFKERSRFEWFTFMLSSLL